MSMASVRRRQHTISCSIFVAVTMLALTIALAPPAFAQIGSARYSSIVVDARTGNLLSSVNPDELRHPASLTKMMTLYMLFEALRDRRVSLDQLVPISAHAASMSPTKLGLVPGSRLTVQEAILGLVTKSANDAAAALGELMGGSEDRFAQMMTLRARALGMSHTTFRNASGLPDPDQWTTARDLAVLARRLIADFPVYYGYFSTPSFTYHRQVIYNHDHLLESYPGADGLKTGYTGASGYNLVTSATRGGIRLIGVVLGAKSGGERDLHMAALLDQAFEQMDVPISRREVRAAHQLPALVSSAQAATLPAVAPHRYGVQVGIFNDERAARQAATGARRAADAGEARVEPTTLHGKRVWRAQLAGLTAGEAQSACSTLARRHKTPCVVLRPEPGQLASR
jgi:D-alanyl-D-alanine carboxypeptidase